MDRLTRGLLVPFCVSLAIVSIPPPAAGQICAWGERTPTPPPRDHHALAFDAARGTTVLFGGYTSTGVDGGTWTWDGVAWSRLAADGGPSARMGHAMAYDAQREVVVLFGGFDAHYDDSSETWEWDGAEWTLRATDGPSARSGHAMAYDSARGVTVLFGGYGTHDSSETWEWDGVAWALRATDGPSPRSGHAMTYDATRGVTVLFGGYGGEYEGDTWEWDGVAWQLRNTEGPSPRCLHVLAFDSAAGTSLLFGGYDGQYRGDTWAWDGTSWTIQDSTGPSARSRAAMAYDTARGVAVLFGGYGQGQFDGQTWEYGANEWTLVSLGGPTRRDGHAAVFDDTRGVTVVFGGYKGGSYSGETWEWDGGGWLLRAIDGPSPRARHAMALDTTRGVTVLFGGYTAQGVSGETWEWDGQVWSLASTTGPTPNAGYSMAYDAGRGVCVLFAHTKTWEWDGIAWELRATDGPSYRYAGALAYDSARGVTVLFGGSSGPPTFFADTWEWDGQAWTLRATDGPPARARHGMCYDIARNVTVLFGGSNYREAVTYGDTWEWDGTSWTRRLIDGPAPRDNHAMAFDSSRGVVVLFGGAGGAYSRFSDTWECPAADLDCNSNGAGDACETSSGTSADCNTNAVPDECEDCDTNGGADECDIADGTATDCNHNGLPDECDLASGAVLDCNTNGVADDCEADCNTNYVNDVCDLAVGSSIDCNTDDIPDECLDCNTNLIADECDVELGLPDCNTNGVPDECDIGYRVVISDDPYARILDSTTFETPAIEVPHDVLVGDVNVCLNVLHTRTSHLSVSLTHETIEQELLEKSGGKHFVDTCLDDEATQSIWEGSAPYSGTFLPRRPLDVFDRTAAAGEWRLAVTDDSAVHTGTLLDWMLDLTVYASYDCNTNALPDECEPGAMPDCNTNGYFDLCEAGPDCNENSVPDECDATFGTSNDCNTNLTPDECELGGCGPFPEEDWDNGEPDGTDGVANQIGGIAPAEVADDFDAGAFGASIMHVIFNDVEDTTFAWDGRVRLSVWPEDENGGPVYDAEHERWEPNDSGSVSRVQVGMTFGRPRWEYTISTSLESDPGVNWIGIIPSSSGSSGQAFWLTSAVPSTFGQSYFRSSFFGYVGWCPMSGVYGQDLDFAFSLSLGCRDCNGNLVPDVCDIADGVLHDINTNTIADECEFDCDHNGVYDYLELEDADCNTNGRLDICDVASSTGSLDCDFNDVPDECQADCDTNGIVDACEVDCNDNGVSDVCDATFGTSMDCDSNLVPDECEVVALSCHYDAEVLCDATILLPALIAFTADEPAQDGACSGATQHRLFAGRTIDGSAKVVRLAADCTIGFPGPWLKRPRSLLVDVNGDWPGSCGQPNHVIVGGRTYDGSDVITILNPDTGTICEQLTFDDAFGVIGQMAIDSAGRLYAGSVIGDCLYRVIDGWVTSFYCPGDLSPRAVALDAEENLYVTTAVDGVLRIIAPDGTPLNEALATGLEGAISQAFAPPGIFHGNLFVACSDRVMEVDLATGASWTFMTDVEAYGIAFDPDGYMYVSQPGEDRILKVGPGLPGDMTGDGFVDPQDLPGFVAALLQAPDAPRPILTADMNGDGCADGQDIDPFVAALFDG